MRCAIFAILMLLSASAFADEPPRPFEPDVAAPWVEAIVPPVLKTLAHISRNDGLVPYGITQRTVWDVSRVKGYPEPPLPYRVEKAFPNITLPCPIYLKREPGTDRWFFIHQIRPWGGACRIYTFQNDPAASETELQLAEEGLIYGLTFHPKYEENGYIYVVSNGPFSEKNKLSRITRYTVDRQPPHRLLQDTALVIYEWHSNGHNGGEADFGPDGMLYFTTGDGTSDSDVNLTGQDLSKPYCKMIRIDVDHPTKERPYSIPADNPFVDRPDALPETWAYGFRNPWRMTFDQKTGHLWVGNNGQDVWEQVYFVRKGENYGWSITEGGHPFNITRQRGPHPITKPTIEHPHSEARSLTGGVVYYGDKLPELNGVYIYGDWASGRIWGAKHDGEKLTWHGELARTTLQITGFALSPEGDLLICDHQGGIYKLLPRPKGEKLPPFPRKLSETGLFTSVKGHQPHPGVIPYSVNSVLWSDGAHKERFIALPDDAKIGVSTHRGWDFDDGAVLVKSFALELEAGNPASRQWIETRLLTKTEGQWYGYTYIWNQDQTDARLVEGEGLDRVFTIKDPAAAGGERQQRWHYPSRTECMVCHTRAQNFVLGLSDAQMNRVHDYGGVKDNQIRTLEHLGAFRINYMNHYYLASSYLDWPTDKIMSLVLLPSRYKARTPQESSDLTKKAWGYFADARKLVLPYPALYAHEKWNQYRGLTWQYLNAKPKFLSLREKEASRLDRMVDPYDAHAPLDARVRSYLSTNCAVCHLVSGGGNALMELDWPKTTDAMKIIDVPPQHDQFNIADAKLVAPGDPNRSVLFHRISRRGRGQMPPLATSQIDPQAVALIRDWILQLKPLPAEKDVAQSK